MSALNARRMKVPHKSRVRVIGACTVIGLIACSGGSALAQRTTRPATFKPLAWVPNGPVNGAARFGDRLVLGGEFSRIGRRTGQAALVTTDHGRLIRGAFPEVAGGAVEAAVSDGAGGVYIGGRFGWVGGLRRSGLAHVLANGSVDRSFNPAVAHARRGFVAEVRALVLSGGVLYVGGAFTRIAGQARSSLAALDATTGQATAWDAHPTLEGDPPEVTALALGGGTLYVAGYFSTIGGAARGGLAALDATSGQATSWSPPIEGSVRAIALSDQVVYLGGFITKVADVERRSLAAVDATSGEPTPWAPNPRLPVRALALDEARVYAGFGRPPESGGPTIEAFDRTDASPRWTVGGNGDTADLLLSGSTLYAGGSFRRLTPPVCRTCVSRAHPRQGVAALNAATGSLLSWAPKPDLYEHFLRVVGEPSAVQALAKLPRGILIGGDFASIGGIPRDGLAALSLPSGRPLAWHTKLSGSVAGLAAGSDRLYLVGPFRTIRGRHRAGAAALDRRLRVLPWNPPALHPFGGAGPLELSVLDKQVVATGAFDGVGGQIGRRVAAFSPLTGRLLAWGPHKLNGPEVVVLAVGGGRIYAAGPFTREHSLVVVLDPRSGHVVHPLVDDQVLHGEVDAATVLGRRLFLGGSVGLPSQRRARGLIAVGTTTGRLLRWPARTNSTVFALFGRSDVIYAGGQFRQVNGKDRVGIAALDAMSGRLLSWNPRLTGFVSRLGAYGDGFFAAGDFLSVGPVSQPFLALFG